MSNQPPFAEYPRPDQGGFASYGRGPGVYFDAIGEAWELFRQDWGTWVAATVVYLVIVWGLSLPISMLTQSMMPAGNPRMDQAGQVFGVLGLQFVLNLLPTAVSTVLFTGMIAMGVRKTRGEYINVAMMFEPFRRFGTIFGASLLYYLILLVSALACIIPMFYFAPVLFLVPVVAYIQGIGPGQALSLTYERCKRHWAGLFGLLFVLGILTVAGFCLCGVGALATFPIYCIVMAIHYRAFFESDSRTQPVSF